MNNTSITVLALDGSTKITGVSLMTIAANGSCNVLAYAALTARETSPSKTDSLTLRMERIADTASQLVAWVGRNVTDAGICLDLVAYERGFHRGQAPTESHHMAIGRYLTISALVGLPIIPVTVGDVKNRAYHALPGVASIDAKRRAVVWGRTFLNLPLTDPDNVTAEDEVELLESEAIADSCAVGYAAVQILREQDAKAEQLAQGKERLRTARRAEQAAVRAETKRIKDAHAATDRLARKVVRESQRAKVKGGAA